MDQKKKLRIAQFIVALAIILIATPLFDFAVAGFSGQSAKRDGGFVLPAPRIAAAPVPLSRALPVNALDDLREIAHAALDNIFFSHGGNDASAIGGMPTIDEDWLRRAVGDVASLNALDLGLVPPRPGGGSPSIGGGGGGGGGNGNGNGNGDQGGGTPGGTMPGPDVPPAVVPLPPAALLFGSALLGLWGFVRRNGRASAA